MRETHEAIGKQEELKPAKRVPVRKVIVHYQKHSFVPCPSDPSRCARRVWFMGKTTTCDCREGELVHQVRNRRQP